ncbi:hypothetical protein Tco_0368742 [Tanacetum coccineum]
MAGSKGKKVVNTFSFYRMETDKISERYIAPCLVNGLEAYDGEINLALDENLISNEYEVKLCLDYEMRKGKKLVKKELIVALKGEIYFMKFIINHKEDNVEPEVILGRSFLILSKGIVDFDNGFAEELPPIVCKMGKSDQNKKKAMENLDMFYQDIRPSSSSGRHLTQGEAEKEALEIRISQKYALLEEKRLVIEMMAYHDKYKKILDEIWKDKRELDKKTVKEDEDAVGVTTLIAEFLILDILMDRNSPIVVGRGFLRTIGDYMRNVESDSDDEEEYVTKGNKFGVPIYGLRPAPYLNCTNLEDRSSAIQAVTNPFRKISVWKKAVSFLGSLRVPLKLVNWKPKYKGSYTKGEEATGQSRTEIRITDPYGNIYLQGFTTKKTDRKLSKYHKLNDIMSPNWFME